MEHAVRTLLDLSLEMATAFFIAASIGIAAGVVAASRTHRLGPALLVALAAFVLAAAGFGYAIWRSQRARSRRMFRRMRAVSAAR
jgi:hypothetical protein